MVAFLRSVLSPDTPHLPSICSQQRTPQSLGGHFWQRCGRDTCFLLSHVWLIVPDTAIRVAVACPRWVLVFVERLWLRCIPAGVGRSWDMTSFRVVCVCPGMNHCMYVCMYACMHVCMFVCMYDCIVCMYVCNVCMYVCNVWNVMYVMYVCNVCMDVCMYVMYVCNACNVCMYACMYACMHVCM